MPDSEELRTGLIQETHDSILCGHPGREGTAGILTRQFFWPKMSQQVRRFVKNCDVCGRNKAWRDRRQGFLKPLPIPSRIWQEISIDFVVGLPLSEGCTNMMVVTDRLSKGIMIQPMKDITAELVADWFVSVYYRAHYLPSAIVSDRGTQFVGTLWRRACQLLKITRRLSTAWNPETDGSTERMNQTIETFLRNFVAFDMRDWSKWTAVAELAINQRDAASTGVSPFFLMHGYHVDPLQLFEQPVVRNDLTRKSPAQKADEIVHKLQEAREYAQSAMASAQQAMEEQANRKRNQAPEFKIGDKVWLNLHNITTNRPSKKLDAKYAKYQVIGVVGTHSYRLDTPPGVHNVFNANKLRLASDDPLPSQKQDDSHPQPVLVGNDEEYDIEKVLDEKKGRGGSRRLLVKWKGYAKPTWEPATALADTVALEEWEQTAGERPAKAPKKRRVAKEG